MSKKRNSSLETPRGLRQKASFESTGVTRYTLNSSLQKSWENLQKRKLKTEALEEDSKLKSIYNKNISKFRDLVNDNDRSVLPFISSLREQMKAKSSFLKKGDLMKTKLEPFKVSEKETCNQKIQKDLADIKGRTRRISNTFYRWHNKTGQNVKNSCVFEAQLRETSQNFRNKKVFKNLQRSPSFKRIEQRVYTQGELVCQKQKRLFRTVD